MSRKIAVAAMSCLVTGFIALFVPSISAHSGFHRETIRGPWVFTESYWGAGQEAAYVGTMLFDGAGQCEMTWVGLKAQGGRSKGADSCVYMVNSDGSGTIAPDSADDIAFQITSHGNRIEYIVDSANVGQVGKGTMTRR